MMIVLVKNSTATTAVRRVRLRSTMWVPPCEVGVKPIPPRPVSRPERMRMGATRAAERRTWRTAKKPTMAQSVPRVSVWRPPACPRRVAAVDEADARERIQKLILTGDNRLKQGVDAAKVRESYEAALALAREHGMEERIRPLIELRLSDLERLARESPPPAPPEA